jgi:hypothetical protein
MFSANYYSGSRVCLAPTVCFCGPPFSTEPSIALGDEHRRIRAGLNVGFTATAVRNYQPVFEKVAEAVYISRNLYSLIMIDVSPDFGTVGELFWINDKHLSTSHSRNSRLDQPRCSVADFLDCPER